MNDRPEFTRSYYPRSFLKLLLLAFAIVALPLVIAFINAAMYVQRLAQQSETAVAQAAQSARGSRMLTEQVTALERVMRQFLILGDRSLLQDYERVRADFKGTTSELSLLPLDELQLRELNRTIDKEQSLYELLNTAPADRPKLIEGYVALSALGRGVLDISNDLIDRELGRMRQTAQHAQEILWWQMLATIPTVVIMALAVTLLIARPIRELDQAIRRLGTGDFGADIRVHGPADLQSLGERLDWMRRRLLDLEQQERLFLRHVSHELKTPLTSLREGSELLAEGTPGPLSDAQRAVVAIVRKNSIALQSLIEDLLNYHSAQDSVARLNIAPVRLDRVVKQALEDHRLAAQARGIRADSRLEPVTLQADAEKLRVVADNLVSNAVKFSPDGGVISLALRREDDAVLDVGDTGPGIPVDDCGRIFDWFYQGEHGHQGRVRGSGLGLAIAREFIVAHGGNIEVVNDGAGGAHFRVRLPLGQPG